MVQAKASDLAKDIGVRITIIDGKGFGLRIIEWLANFRARVFQMPYGDQALFVRSDLFSAVGGFPTLPILEDFELVRKLKHKGHIAILSLGATTSPRRWENLGVLQTTLINQAIILGYLLGVAPEKLAAWYRKERNPKRIKETAASRNKFSHR